MDGIRWVESDGIGWILAGPSRPTLAFLCPPCSKQLQPASQSARLEEVQVYRVGGGPKAPSSALPIGEPACLPPALPLLLLRGSRGIWNRRCC